ncbi:hypothetical protein KXS11_08555 [Plantibacter flavus]|uniref:sensor histidine kinase n=1 Tax=Plantibacter flavus TaxID=150123 RepID=UPI003F1914EB
MSTTRTAHQRERNLAAVFSIGLGVVAAVSFTGMLTVVVQPQAIVLPWPYRALLFALFGIAIVLGVSAVRARLETIRRLAGAFVVVSLVAYAALWPSLLLFGSTGRPGQLTWVLTTTALPVIAAAIAWGPVGGWTLLGIVAIVVPVLRALVGDTSPNGVVNDVHSIAFAMLFCVITTTLLESARLADVAASAAQATTAERTQQLAREASQVRTHALVHDEVLATLGFAARATPEMRPLLADQARRALAAITALTGAAPPAVGTEPTGSEPTGSTTTADPESDPEARALRRDRLAHMVRHVAAEHGVTAQLLSEESTDSTHGTAPMIPSEATAALLGALRQALVNAERHAGPAARVRVIAELADDRVRLIVQDDGVGFDPDLRVDGRMGVPVSILARLRTVRGGWASVSSAPGAGTTVVLEWSPPPATPDRSARRRRTLPVAEGSVWRKRRMSGFVSVTFLAMLGLLATVAALRTGSPAPFVPAALLGAGLVALAPRAEDRATPRVAVAALALATGASAVGMSSLPTPVTLVYADAWFVPCTAFVLALLAFRGRPVSAAVGVLLVVAVVVIGVGIADVDVKQLVSAVVRLLFITAIAIALVYTDGALNSRAERDRATALAAAEDRAWAVTTRAELRTRGLALVALVEPLLLRIASGDELTRSEERECQVLEGRLRDEYRSGRLAREPLMAAAAAARRRGVDVVLLDDVPERSIPEETLVAVVAWLALALDDASSDRFAGRLLPDGRSGVAVAIDGERATSFGG